MAEIAPFRGLRYNPEKVQNLNEVVIPPYDVITPNEQHGYHLANPYNMIRLELGEARPDDSAENNSHTRASKYLKEWRDSRVLVMDEHPAIYYYELDYSVGSLSCRTRCGFICALRLEDFGSGLVRPHEKTFQSVKDERLSLMLACNANLSPVFALFDDPEKRVDRSLRAGMDPEMLIRFRDSNGMEHRVSRVRDPDTLRHVRELLKDKDIFIADGHHRYETAINYRDIQRKRFKDAGRNASFEFIMIYLANIDQSGLTILPTHRMLRNLDSMKPGAFLESARRFFHVSSISASNGGEREWDARLEEGRAKKETVIGFYCHSQEQFHLLRARRDEVASQLRSSGIPEVLHELDVVILDQIILRRLLSLNESYLGDENNIHFKHDIGEGLMEIQNGAYEAGFFINATRIEQVQAVARAGLIMPHKSTYFYPKVGSGIIVRPLEPREQMLW